MIKSLILILCALNTINADEDYSTNAVMQDTLNNEYKLVDKKLNKVYSQVINNLDKEEKKDLKSAQRAWLKYRDAECHFQSYPMRGGTGEYTMELSCLIELTDIRTKILTTSI